MSRRIPILLYHSISEAATPDYQRWAISPATFAEQMAYVHKAGYVPITVTQFVALMGNQEAALPTRPIVLTFDDGMEDFYTGALPILAGHDFAATLYITTGYIGATSRWLRPLGEGGRPMLGWSQVAEIQARGVECGGHSHTHPQLDTLPHAAARNEITICKSLLEQHLGQEVVSFAYPHGYYSTAVRRMAREAGYSSACAVKHAMSTTVDDRFALARIILTPDVDMEVFAGLLEGKGLVIAPGRERMRTTAWRLARRAVALVKRGQHNETSL